MISRAGLALPMVAGFLLIVLAGEWLLPGPGAPDWQQRPAIPSAMAEGQGRSDAAQWASIILARPLLSPSRRPAAAPEAVVSETLPRLSAIIVIGGARHAIFAATGQKPQLVAQGGGIGAFTITDVAPDKVDLLGPSGKMTLKPQFIAGAQTQPGAPAQQ